MIERVKKAVLLLIEDPLEFFNLLFLKYPRSIMKNALFFIAQWFCITVFKLTVMEKYSRIESSVPWIVILSTKDIILKISWRAESIDHEIENMQLLYGFEPLRVIVLPFHHKKHLWYSAIETQRRYPIMDNAELFKAAEEILERFKCCGEVRCNNRIDDFVQIMNGLKVVQEICGSEKRKICANHITELLGKESIYVGPAHGDFHPRNVLKDLNGNNYIIDLDCFRLRGIQALDVIYFFNEYYANKNKINWYQQLILFVENKQSYSTDEFSFLGKFCKISNQQWLLMYFLDRLGQNMAYTASISEMPVREITEFLNSYLKINNQGCQ